MDIVLSLGLGLRRMTDSNLGGYASQRIFDLTKNAASFPGLQPDAPQLEVILNAYRAALAKCGKMGNPYYTRVKKVKRLKLENALNTCALNCLEIADGNVALFYLSGFRLKNKGHRISELNKPLITHYEQGSNEGSVYVYFKGVPNARGYEIKVGETEDIDSNLLQSFFYSSSPVLIKNLKSLSRNYVKIRAIGTKNITSGWTGPFQIKVL